MSSAEMESAAAPTQGDAWDKFLFRGIALFWRPALSPGLCAGPAPTRAAGATLGRAAPTPSHRLLGFSPSSGLLQEPLGFLGSGTGQPSLLGCVLPTTGHHLALLGLFWSWEVRSSFGSSDFQRVPRWGVWVRALLFGKNWAVLVLNHKKNIWAGKLLAMLFCCHFFPYLPKILCALALICFASLAAVLEIKFTSHQKQKGFSSRCRYWGKRQRPRPHLRARRGEWQSLWRFALWSLFRIWALKSLAEYHSHGVPFYRQSRTGSKGNP